MTKCQIAADKMSSQQKKKKHHQRLTRKCRGSNSEMFLIVIFVLQ